MRFRSLFFTGVIGSLLNSVAFADIAPNEFSKQFQSCIAQDASLSTAIDCQEREIMLQQDWLKKVMAKHYAEAKDDPKLMAAFKKEEIKYKAYEDALCGDVMQALLGGAGSGPMMHATNFCLMRLGRDHLIDLERSTQF